MNKMLIVCAASVLVLSLVLLAMLAGPAGSGRAEAVKAVESLRRLDAATRSGVNRSDYARLVTDVRYDADAALRRLPRGSDLAKHIESAAHDYNQAAVLWDAAGYEHSREHMTAYWVRAAESTSKAARILGL
ncbi:MAG: hypothetical protein ACK4S4_16015 [Pyrinomonadaceae bacterium]